eukprot:TRINITY_DN30541_c0_g1_i1.p1 TRINITY_DN30541_c0_g1~~TRINITY_DN30541_c0_g1_i1.p1  ORF type:complete len:224 (+),score=41.30 TRINITY_DN30541_c0_g1_i1:62-733(+)
MGAHVCCCAEEGLVKDPLVDPAGAYLVLREAAVAQTPQLGAAALFKLQPGRQVTVVQTCVQRDRVRGRLSHVEQVPTGGWFSVRVLGSSCCRSAPWARYLGPPMTPSSPWGPGSDACADPCRSPRRGDLPGLLHSFAAAGGLEKAPDWMVTALDRLLVHIGRAEALRVLALLPDATEAAVRARVKELLFKLHPDRATIEAIRSSMRARFQLANHAKSVLLPAG